MPINHSWNGSILTITSDSGTTAADLRGEKGDKGERGARGLPGDISRLGDIAAAVNAEAAAADAKIAELNTKLNEAQETINAADEIADIKADTQVIADTVKAIVAGNEAYTKQESDTRYAPPIIPNAIGNPVAVKDASSRPAEGLVINLEPKQAGSGNPYPAGGGKNKLSLNKLINTQANNVSVAKTDNYMDMRITAINNGFQQYEGYLDIPIDWKGKTFTFSSVMDVNVNRGNVEPKIYVKDNNDNYLVSLDYTKSMIGEGKRTFTINNDATQLLFIFRACQNQVFPVDGVIYISSIQLEEGGAQTSFEPYENIRPITGHTGVNTTVCGKNLFNLNKSPDKNNYATPSAINNGLRITANTDGTHRLCRFYLDNYELEAGVSYTLSANVIASAANSPAIMSGVYDKNDNTIASIKLKQGTGYLTTTFTITDEYIGAGNRIGVVLYANVNGECLSGDYAEFTNIQLEAGSAATAYEPYSGNTYNSAFNDTIYGGKLDLVSGVLTVDRKYIEFNGSESWNDAGAFTLAITDTAAPNNTASGYGVIGVCSHYNYEWWWVGYGVYVDENAFVVGQGLAETFNGVANWKNQLAEWKAAGKPMTFAYKIATPYTIQLTPQQISTLYPNTTVYNDASADVELRYVADTKLYIDNKLVELTAAMTGGE